MKTFKKKAVKKKAVKKKFQSKFQWIGECGVDSGQLMVCDPCYLAKEWNFDSGGNLGTASYYQDSEGRHFACSCHWETPPIPGCIMFDNYNSSIPECGGRCASDLAREWRVLPPLPPSGEFSYKGCRQATGSDASAGELNFKNDHPGAGVVFSSGYGDGVYPVYARKNREGRIVEVRIKMS